MYVVLCILVHNYCLMGKSRNIMRGPTTVCACTKNHLRKVGGMLGKMHACVVSVYQALKENESLGTRLSPPPPPPMITLWIYSGHNTRTSA